ncbi:MAG: hypothetical protein D6743_20260 [Calditrichaeota bacterium]|nr:MAG: hypothetical protein D6743_20260 [Calditrichota bacterium]
MGAKWIFRRLGLMCISMSVWLAACGVLDSDNTPLEERVLCSALDVGTVAEFRNRGNTAHFEQLAHEHETFLFTSPLVAENLDGQNVVELTYARVEFDYEDEEVDPLDRGGFWARWKMVLVPFDPALLEEFGRATGRSAREDLLNLMLGAVDRIELQLPGPFLKTGCEWGDTDELGTQTLSYSNLAVYDWDFFPGVDRILGILYEGDERVNDDFIAWLDISTGSGDVVVEQPEKYRIVFKAMSSVTLSAETD